MPKWVVLGDRAIPAPEVVDGIDENRGACLVVVDRAGPEPNLVRGGAPLDAHCPIVPDLGSGPIEGPQRQVLMSSGWCSSAALSSSASYAISIFDVVMRVTASAGTTRVVPSA